MAKAVGERGGTHASAGQRGSRAGGQAEDRTIKDEGCANDVISAEDVGEVKAQANSSAARLKELLLDGSDDDLSSVYSARRRLLSPLEIHFSQSHVRPEFQDGRVVDETIADIERELLSPVTQDNTGNEISGLPVGDESWWILTPPFQEIEVIQWRCKLREEDGTQICDDQGNDLYGDKEWFTLDNRRLYCLQKVAARLYPQEVRCAVVVIAQEEGNHREFRKFNTPDRGRSVGIGHRDSVGLPRFSWRREVGLPEEVLSAGTAVVKPPARRRGPNSGRQQWGGKNSGRRNSKEDEQDSSKMDMAKNIAFFVLVYFALRLAFHTGRHLLNNGAAIDSPVETLGS